MTDFIAKARANRIIALNLKADGAVMFFPEDVNEAPGNVTDLASHRDSARDLDYMSKPLFVRSESITEATRVSAPDIATVANETGEPLVLTEDLAVRRAA